MSGRSLDLTPDLAGRWSAEGVHGGPDGVW